MNQATKSKKTARFVAATLSAALLLSSAALANVNYVSADEGEPLFVSDYSSKAEAVQAGLDLHVDPGGPPQPGGRPGQEAASPQAGCYGPEGTSLLAC